MPQVIKDILGSKKALAALAGFIVAAVGRIGLDLDAEAVTQILAPIIAYILGQGIADLSKSK